MNMDPSSAPIAFLPLVFGLAAAKAIVTELERIKPLPKVLFVEGADFLCDATDKIESAQFLKYMAQIADHYNLALILSVGCPKRKIGEGYAGKRDSIFGSEAWARLTTTLAMLEFASDDMSDARVLSVLPRNDRPERFNMRFSSAGQLELVRESEAAPVKPTPEEWLRSQKGWFRSGNLEVALDLSQSSASRKLKQWLELELVETRDIKNGRAWIIEYQYKV